MSLEEIQDTPFYTKYTPSYTTPEEEPLPTQPIKRAPSTIPTWKHGPSYGTAVQPTPQPTPSTPFPDQSIPEWKYGPDINTAVQPTPQTPHEEYHVAVWEKNVAPSGRVISRYTQPVIPLFPSTQKGFSFLDAFSMATSGTTPYQARQAARYGYLTTATPMGTLIATPRKTYEFGKEVAIQSAMNIGLPYAGGYALGLASGATRGYLLGKGSLTALQWFGRTEKTIGIALGGYAAYDVGRTYQTQGLEPAVIKAAQTGAAFAFLGAGYKGGSAKGFKYGSQKGFEKFLKTEYSSGRINQSTYTAALEGSQARYRIDKQIQNFTVNQSAPKFTDIQSFQTQPKLRSYFEGKLKTGKGEIFGGASSNKPQGTHDLDVMLKPKETMLARYVSQDYLKIGGVENYADVKMVQHPGQIVGEMGSIKLEPTTIGGYRVMRWTEQFSRLSGSSLRPAHSGRLKDIPESTRMLDQILSGKSLSSKLETDVAVYNRSMKYFESLGEKNPLIRSATQTDQIYGSSYSERLYKARTRFWEKAYPEKWKQTDALKYTSGRGRTAETSGDGYLPPSIKSSFSPSFYGGFSLSRFIPSYSSSFSSSYSSSFSSVLSPSSISKSISVSPSLYSPSIPYKSLSKSLSYSPKIPSPSPSYPSKSSSYYPSYPSIPYSPSVSPPSSSYSPSYDYPPSYPFIPKKWVGSGGYGGGEIFHATRYKFREFKIPEILL